jgi:hypothetical protein
MSRGFPRLFTTIMSGGWGFRAVVFLVVFAIVLLLSGLCPSIYIWLILVTRAASLSRQGPGAAPV